MLGYYHFTGAGGRTRLIPHAVRGMEVLELRLPGSADGFLASRRLARGMDRLERAGCRRLLIPCATRPGLEAVTTRDLWQRVSGRLAIAALEGRHLVPGQAVVGIHAQRLSRNLLRCCGYLAPRVRALALSPPAERLLGWELERTYGLPLVASGAQVTLSFAPGISSRNCFALGVANPVIPGFTLTLPGLEPPEGCPELPLLAALLLQGRLPGAEVVVTAENLSGHLDRPPENPYTKLNM